MGNKRNFWVGIIVASALAVMGCTDDENGGAAGNGGNGGTGGTPATGNVTAVHLAPEVPSADDTAVALFVDGAEATDLGTLEYSQSTGKIALPVGTYDIGIGRPGDADPLLSLDGVAVTEETDLVVVAYRTNDELPVNVFVFDNSTEGLAAGSGRVFVGHGANDPALSPVNVVTTDAAEPTSCTELIPGFIFRETKPDVAGGDPPLDIADDSVFVALDLDEVCPPATLGPVAVPVTDNVVSILVAVDEDTADFDGETGLNAELWAIIPDAAAPDNQPIRTIQTPQ